MAESGDSFPLPPSTSPPNDTKPLLLIRRRRRRCVLFSCLCFLLLLLLLAAIGVILFFTLLRPRDPRIQLVSSTVSGVVPRLTFPALSISLNLTIALDILVYNPNRASFSHSHGSTRLFYRSIYVGDADVLPGRIPARGSTHVAVALTIDGSRLAAEAGRLISDAMTGEVSFDAETRIPGTVKLLGFIRHHAVALSECHVDVGFPDLKVRRQECSQKTKL
ncbi:hypothetical protein KSP39_PZI018708 [Platanthera zijinensis]|uniref:Late embryogenesis abundant protein LEA-2 subgroup domain-containing protein n=1 Tax=Platanthera zijinensis TaxID=2320716 RepID=A0AAP0B3A3_9ASPA